MMIACDDQLQRISRRGGRGPSRSAVGRWPRRTSFQSVGNYVQLLLNFGAFGANAVGETNGATCMNCEDDHKAETPPTPTTSSASAGTATDGFTTTPQPQQQTDGWRDAPAGSGIPGRTEYRTHRQRMRDRRSRKVAERQKDHVESARAAKAKTVSVRKLRAAGCPKLASAYQRWYRILASEKRSELGAEYVRRLLVAADE